MKIAYFATKLSDHLSRTPEGFLIAKDCVIARTGFQRYLVRDLDPEVLKELGVTFPSDTAYIDVYRPEKEVFSLATIASFEAKPTTDDHPVDGYVDINNIRTYQRGHAQNIRKGWEPLDSGDWPMIADLIFTDQNLIYKIENQGLRELSCGYKYELQWDGDRLVQTAIVGNHIAVVPRGRAGHEARIVDSDSTAVAEHAPAKEAAVQTSAPGTRPIKQKGYGMNRPTMLDRIFGLGVKSMAQDENTSPEDLAQLMKLGNHRSSGNDAESEEEREKERETEKAKDALDKRAKDAETELEKEREEHKKTKDALDKMTRDSAALGEEMVKAKDALDKHAKAGKDAEEAGNHYKACGEKDCMDRDCRMHGALDEILTKHPKAEGMDADLEELGKLFEQFNGGGGENADADIIEPIGAEEMTQAHDARALDAAAIARDAELQLLKELKPIVARSKNSALIQAFNQRLAVSNRKSKASDGTYAGFAAAGAIRPTRTANNNGAQPGPENGELQNLYDAMLAGKSIKEVA